MSPLSLIAYILGACLLALVLLTAFPAVLMVWGPFLGWFFLSIILVWFGVDEVDAWFMEEGEALTSLKTETGVILKSLRESRAQHDSFGVGTYSETDVILPPLRALLHYRLVIVEEHADGSAWWRAA